MIFGTPREIADVISRANVCIDRLRGFGLTKGQIWGLRQETAMTLATVCCTDVHIRDSLIYKVPEIMQLFFTFRLHIGTVDRPYFPFDHSPLNLL